MQRNELTNWNLTPSECIALQKRCRSLVQRRWDGRAVRRIAGTDVHFPTRKTARASIVVLSYPALEPLESQVHTGPVTMPYIPGLLSFREIPPLLEAWRKLETAVDLILCDGQGIAHPRGLGLASHLGLVLDHPAIGCAKSPLYGAFEQPGTEKGKRTPIIDRNGGTIGAAVRTRRDTKPVFVSVGHRIDLRTAVGIVLACSPRYRIPEPLRAAHRLAGVKD